MKLDETDQRNTTVRTVALDDFCESMRLEGEDISLIKMDIEGAEMMALLGMQRLIQNSKTLVLISEFIPRLMSRSGFSAEDYILKLRENQFSVRVIRKKKIRHSSRAEIVPIEDTVQAGYTVGANLICCKK